MTPGISEATIYAFHSFIYSKVEQYVILYNEGGFRLKINGSPVPIFRNCKNNFNSRNVYMLIHKLCALIPSKVEKKSIKGKYSQFFSDLQ